MAGTTLNISKDGIAVWWFITMWKASKVCIEPNATGWTGWDSRTPENGLSGSLYRLLPSLRYRP